MNVLDIAKSQSEDPTPATDESRWWEELRSTNHGEAREHLFVMHLSYAKAIAARLYGGCRHNDVEFKDFYQLACIGLLESIDRYDVSRGVLFRTFCTRRIEGSVLSGVERLTEAQQQISARKRIVKERLGSLRQEGDPEEHSTREAKIALALLAEVAMGLTIGFMLEETGMYRGEDEPHVEASAYETAAWCEAKRRVLGLVEQLPRRENKIIAYHYFHGLGFDQIGDLLGLTKGRISQLHGAALKKLRERMTARTNFSLTR